MGGRVLTGQLDLFEATPLKINKPIRLIELFAGIGSQAKALENLGADFEHYRICEFDKYAVKSYNAVHGTAFETSDITQIHAEDLGVVDTDKYCYIMTYSFPCQDISNAGKQRGYDRGSGTRSGLLWEVERLLNEMDEKPQILLMENVPQVHSKKNIDNFNDWISSLESLGYTSVYQDLNAKDYGIPQNRNRCFMVSWLGNFSYKFPAPRPLELKLRDMLEDSVDEKYYLSDQTVDKLVNNLSDDQRKLLERELPSEPKRTESVSRDFTHAHGKRLQGSGKPADGGSDISQCIRCGGRGSTDKNHRWDLVYD